MSQVPFFVVEFRVVKPSAGGGGSAYAYARPLRKVSLTAASAHPKDILAVLNADIAVGSGETIEILSVASGNASGTEQGGVSEVFE